MGLSAMSPFFIGAKVRKNFRSYILLSNYSLKKLSIM